MVVCLFLLAQEFADPSQHLQLSTEAKAPPAGMECVEEMHIQWRLLSTAREEFEWIFDCLGMCPSVSTGFDPNNLAILGSPHFSAAYLAQPVRLIFLLSLLWDHTGWFLILYVPKGFAVPCWQSPGHSWFCWSTAPQPTPQPLRLGIPFSSCPLFWLPSTPAPTGLYLG